MEFESEKEPKQNEKRAEYQRKFRLVLERSISFEIQCYFLFIFERRIEKSKTENNGKYVIRKKGKIEWDSECKLFWYDSKAAKVENPIGW